MSSHTIDNVLVLLHASYECNANCPYCENQFIRYEYKGIVYDLPVLMEDDTNSDGLQQVKYATTVDTRRAITYGANYITKTISVGQRFMIKSKDVYKVTNISDFEYNGDTYKIKTFKEITKLERNEMFVYESVPGTAVEKFSNSNEEIKFFVEGFEDAQITLELEAETEYDITVNGKDAGTMKTNLGGKLSLSVELDPKSRVEVSIKKK